MEEKYQLRKQEVFKAVKNNRALSGLEAFLLLLLFLRGGKVSSYEMKRNFGKYLSASRRK